MRTIFHDEGHEQFFRANGYVTFDLLDEEAVGSILSFYADEFKAGREVYDFAKALPYYISVFDVDGEHKRRVDALISDHVRRPTEALLRDYEIFYSNLMIKFPGDGQIEAHQDFNFVDESEHTAFNLWCPLVDTGSQNGGLYVVPGSHRVFRTQRGPNIPKALTQYNELLQRYATLIPLKKGQAIIFDHKLIHYSPPNNTPDVRVAVQSVLKPREVPALHYFFDGQAGQVQAYRIGKEYILETNLWEADVQALTPDHSEALIPFPAEEEVIDALVKLKLHYTEHPVRPTMPRPLFKDVETQRAFERDGFVKLPVLSGAEVSRLKEVFAELIGEDVKNTDYGMYISLEEEDERLKASVLEQISAQLFPAVREHFLRCKPHLGSFLVKAPGDYSYTYPHQDWTFVTSPDYCSVTVWVALVDVDERNGALGFVKGSHKMSDRPVGSPSPYFHTFTEGHEDVFYEYLEIVPLKAGEAVAFDNRTIHGAPPNLADTNRLAAAIGMTPEEAPLYHFYLLPGGDGGREGDRRVARLKVDQQFFQQYSVASLKRLFERGEAPLNYEVEAVFEETFHPYSRREIQKLCEHAGLKKNGKRLAPAPAPSGKRFPVAAAYMEKARSMARHVWGRISKAKV